VVPSSGGSPFEEGSPKIAKSGESSSHTPHAAADPGRACRTITWQRYAGGDLVPRCALNLWSGACNDSACGQVHREHLPAGRYNIGPRARDSLIDPGALSDGHFQSGHGVHNWNSHVHHAATAYRCTTSALLDAVAARFTSRQLCCTCDCQLVLLAFVSSSRHGIFSFEGRDCCACVDRSPMGSTAPKYTVLAAVDCSQCWPSSS
jgi:hypothetical protein